MTKPAVGSIDCIQHTRQGCVYHFWAAAAASTLKTRSTEFSMCFFFVCFGWLLFKILSIISRQRRNFRKFFFRFFLIFCYFGSRFVFNEHQLICRSVWRQTQRVQEGAGELGAGFGSSLGSAVEHNKVFSRTKTPTHTHTLDLHAVQGRHMTSLALALALAVVLKVFWHCMHKIYNI